jgi:exosortase
MVIVAAGLAVLLVPVLVDIARLYWSTPSGAQAPLILASGLWLLWRERGSIRFQPGSVSARWLFVLVPLLLLYLFGRNFHLLGTEAIATYAILITLGYFYIGVPAMHRLWFVWLYLAFLIPPPQSLVVFLTSPLQIGLSEIAVRLLHAASYPIGNSGVSIQIGQYELLVAEACSGIGSLVALLAIGLLFVHLTRPEGGRHALLLLVGIIPIALAANLLRVMIVILLTYHVSDAVAQSFVHGLAGIFTFALSLAGLSALDRFLTSVKRPSLQ